MTDFYKTRTQLKEEAALAIGVIEPGEALSAEDNDTLDGKIDPLLAELAEDQIVYIGDTEQIELAYFLPLARLLANVSGPAFGSPVNEDARRLDEAKLRRLTSTKPSGEVLKTDYY